MNLPFTPKSEITKAREYYFSIEIGAGNLKTALWTVENEKVQVLAVGSYEKYLNPQDFIEAADRSLSATCTGLKIDAAGIKSVILGLPANWLSGDKILPEKSKFLKDVCHTLDLKPVGFVITTEALVKYLHGVEGVPPTAILTGISDGELEITVVRLGKIVGTQTVKRGSSIAEDVKEGMSRFLPYDLFPSRILLFDHGSEMENVRQTLLGYPWQAPQHKLPFLHFPKIDILSSDSAIKAICMTAGLEAINNKSSEVRVDDKKEIISVDLGFVENLDLAKQPHSIKAKIEEKKEVVKKIQTPHLKIPKINLPKVAIIIPLVIIGVLIFGWWRFVKVKVLLTLIPQSASVKFTTNLPIRLIETQIQTEVGLPTTGTTLVGDKATGSVTIVNGTNQIKSFPSGTEIVAPNNLKFVTTGNVTVASASGTADPNSYQPGKSDVNVIAETIGSDSNLSAGSEFKINGFSTLDYVAKNSAAFSGGTSRQAQAVASEDIASIKSKADNDIVNKLKDAISKSINPGEIVVDPSIKTQIINESIDHKVNDPADQINLIRKVKVVASVYKQTDLDTAVNEKLTPLIAKDSRALTSPKIDIDFKSASKNSYQVSILATSEFASEIDTEQAVTSLLGKPHIASETLFGKLPGFSNIEISYNPKWASFIKYFPWRKENLTVFTTYTSP